MIEIEKVTRLLRSLTILALLLPATLLAQSWIVSVAPMQNRANVPKDTVISVTFDRDINSSTLTNSTVKINGSLSGPHAATYSYDGLTKTVTITAAAPFKVGEVVTTTLTRGIKTTAEDSLASAFCWQFFLYS